MAIDGDWVVTRWMCTCLGDEENKEKRGNQRRVGIWNEVKRVRVGL